MASLKVVYICFATLICVYILTTSVDAKAKKIHAPSYASKFDLVQEAEEERHRWRRDTDDDEDVDPVIAELDRLLAEIRALRYRAQVDTQGQNRAANQANAQYPVRLQGGPAESDGRVEIRFENSWYMVCDDGWGIEEANVVCRQLGYTGALAAVQRGADRYGYNDNGFAMDDVVCTGMETELSQCEFAEWGWHNCDKGQEVAGVRCQPEISTPSRAARSVQGASTVPESPGVVLRFNVNDLPPWLQSILGSKPETSTTGSGPGSSPGSATGGASSSGASGSSSTSGGAGGTGAGSSGATGETGNQGSGASGGSTGDSPVPVARARAPECFTTPNGQDYRGVVSQTISGYTCQRWNVQTPHPHSYTPAQYPGILGNHNHCRNPGTFSQPWCYTTNPRIIREYCDVGNPRTSCAVASQSPQGTGETTSFLSQFALNSGAYIAGHNDGTHSVATPELCAQQCRQETGFACRSFEYNQQSNECFTSSSNSRDVDLTFILNTPFNYYERLDIGPVSLFDMTPNSAMPGNNIESLTAVSMEECAEKCLVAPWPCASFDFARRAKRCWLSNKSPSQVAIRNDFPDNPYDFFARRGPATPNCFSGNGEDYRGFSFTTVQGHQCTNWLAAASDNVGVTPALFPHGGLGNHNFCRNPDSDRSPWCYYKNPGSTTVSAWMYCNISRCATPTAPPTQRPATHPPPNTQAPSGPIPISRGKPAFQSSTANAQGVTGNAGLAVDGNPDPVYRHGSCSRTQHRADSWWYVDLEATYDVTTVVIVNKDIQGERLRGASITIGSSATDPSTRTLCGRVNRAMTNAASLSPHKRITFECPTPIRGQYVHIGSPRKDYLSLCEVEVYGTPSSPTPTAPEPTVICTAEEFECASGSVSCVPERLQCNGQNDCTDGSDENGCPDPMDDFTLMADKYLPNREPSVVYMEKTADECARFCVSAMTFVCRSFDYIAAERTCSLFNVSRSQNGRLFERQGVSHYERISQTQDCTNANGIEYHPCPSGRCIPNDWLCDGDNDCGDFTDETNCGTAEEFDVRIVNGTAPNEGRVEVKYGGKWGLVCDDDWDISDGNVVCKQLGYRRGASRVYTVGEFGHGSLVDILMDDVQCLGDEPSLADCAHPGFGIHNCVVGEAAGVLCKLNQDCPANHFECNNLKCIPQGNVCNDMDDCNDGSDELNCQPELPVLPVRLVGGNGRTSGRVEVLHNNVWGTVCDDYFSEEAARVVCNQLGISGDVRVYPQASFGEGTGQIWLDDVTCTGTEPSLAQCTIPNGIGRHNCGHSEDVGVECGRETLPCGIRGIDNGNIMARIIGGSSAKRGNWPWQAQLILRGSGHYCGGTLIDDYHVLSAAHCFQRYGKSSFKVRLGEHHQDINEGSEQDFGIECLYKHPDYNSRTTNNDIAVLRLDRPAQITTFVTPACLPTEGEFSANHQCWISGWGNTGDNTYPSRLQEARVPLLPRSTCTRPNVYGQKLTSQMLCAGYLRGGIDSCDGDSGGPLVCENGDSIWKVVGVTSWGYGCAQPNAPGVYAVVTRFLGWINNMRNTRTCL